MSKLIGYKNRLWEVIHDFKYTGEDQPFTLQRGTYLFICNGATGGTLDTNNYGIKRMKERGGTSYGVLTLNSTKTFHAVVGGSGSSPTTNVNECYGGFNGGSPGGLPYSNSYMYGASGGGASDVRLMPYDENEYPTYDANGELIEPTTQRKIIGGSYYQLEYIKAADGTSINTQYIPKSNTKIVFDGVIINRTQNLAYAIFGCRSGFQGDGQIATSTYINAFEFYSRFGGRDNIVRYMRYTGTASESADFIFNNRIRLECYQTKAEWFVNGVSVGKVEVSDRDACNCDYPLVINGSSQGQSTIVTCSMILHRFTISEINGDSETIVHDFYPCCKIVDKTIFGLYDVIDDTFIQVNEPSWSRGPLVTEHPSLNSRIIVAGGAGGSNCVLNDNNVFITSGTSSGGGTCGHNVMYTDAYNYEPNFGLCASQTIGYAFGYSNRATKRPNIGESCNGAGGGGGGWYGGFTSQCTNGTSYMSLNGGGGSGYVLTDTSYKPFGYEPSSDYYFTDETMTTGTSTDGGIMICKLVSKYNINDVIEFPCIGECEKITLMSGSYKFKCYGGDGGYRKYSAYAARGGYTEGSILLKSDVDAFIRVGGSGFPFWNVGHGNYPVNTHRHSVASQVSYNGGGVPNDSEPDINRISGGGASDVRFEIDDLNHRVIVAGGAGSEGAHGYYGGDGGGETGNWASTSGLGINNGPGTQTESPSDQQPLVAGSFGQGGHSISQNIGFGGAGGGGWFGGSGTYPDSWYDNERGGSGGSGYVLTQDSYKPDGYAFVNDEYNFTNTVLSTGGNTLDLFQTKVVIEVLGIMRPTICHDEDGYKIFNTDEGKWILIDPQPIDITPSLFETYDSSLFMNDEGLLQSYDVYIFDQKHETNSIVMNVVPPRQTISYILEMRGVVKDVIVDSMDYDPEHYAVGVIPSTDIDDQHKQINIVIDKFVPTTEPFGIYSAQIQSAGNYGSHKYINPDGKRDYYTYDPTKKEIVHDRRKFEYRDPEDYRDETGRIMTAQWLLPAGKGNRIPSSYRNDVCESDMIHMCCSTIAEYNRTIYLAYVMSTANSSSWQYLYFVVKSVSMMTGRVNHVYRIPWYDLTGSTYADLGGFLIDSQFMYVGYSNGITNFIKINRKTFEVTRTPSITDAGGGLQYWGKMQWYDSNNIAVITGLGMYLYDIYENIWKKLFSYTISSCGDFHIGKKYILCGYHNNTRQLILYNRETNIVSTMPLLVDGCPSICYDGIDKFYVVQRGRIYEFNESTGTLSDPVVVSVVGSYHACSYTNNGVIIFNYDSTNLTIFNTEQKIYSSIYLPWSLGFGGRWNWGYSSGPKNGVYSGFAINGFYFFMGYTMLTMNYTGNAKYNMGYKFNQYMILYNIEHEDHLTYDSRFIDVDDSSVFIHDGNIEFDFGDYSSNHIACAHIDKKQYNHINRISMK